MFKSFKILHPSGQGFELVFQPSVDQRIEFIVAKFEDKVLELILKAYMKKIFICLFLRPVPDFAGFFGNPAFPIRNPIHYIP